jgi:Fic-DOC domain mobile mystery protein B
MKFYCDENATPVSPDDIRNLIPAHIQTQAELNLWEQNNISDAENKLFRSKKELSMSVEFVKKTHNLMFNETWKWAGKFRTFDTNIGIKWINIRQELHTLCEDFHFQISNASYPLEESAIRFGHRLVSIHPFPNGNGRCSRLLADLIMFKNNQDRFSWGSKNLTAMSETRKRYIQALREADNFNIEPLLEFARS